jgi:anion-transporting  ArsA/GET3 family ATPase
VAALTGLARRLAGKRVVVCAGAGGVGKTTVSAAVAIGLAARGRRVALVTIDPARRLAEALGLATLDNEPRPVDRRRLAYADVLPGGELWAMMLDVRGTFDEVVARLAPNEQTRDEILSNRVYRQLSTAVAGSQEYAAIAKLFEIEREGAYDTIVLDTPPSRNALDFLDAPRRLTAFLEGRSLAIFMLPARGATRAAGAVLAALGRVIGAAMLTEMATFFSLVSGLAGGLRERAAGVQTLLNDPATSFLVVSSPERGPLEEAIFLASELEAAGMHRSGVVVNRVHARDATDEGLARNTARLTPALGARLADKVARTHAEVQLLSGRDDAAVERLRLALDSAPICLADREGDVRDVEGLIDLTRELFGEPRGGEAGGPD